MYYIAFISAQRYGFSRFAFGFAVTPREQRRREHCPISHNLGCGRQVWWPRRSSASLGARRRCRWRRSPPAAACARAAPPSRGTQSDEMGIPCIGECSLPSYPNLPDSVHPGVVTGQALIDLLNDAKEKGYAIPAVNFGASARPPCLTASVSALRHASAHTPHATHRRARRACEQ